MVEQTTFYISDHTCDDYRCRTVYTESEIEAKNLQQHFKVHGGKPMRIKFRAWDFDIDRSTFHAFFDCIIQFHRWTPRCILQDNGFRRRARIELGAKPPSLVLTAKDKALILDRLVALGCSIAGDNKEEEGEEQPDVSLLIYRTYSQFPYRWDIVEAWSIGTYHTDKEEHRHVIREKYPGAAEEEKYLRKGASYD